MGKPRKIDCHLPLRIYVHHGAYTFRDKKGTRHNLGKDLKQAMLNLEAMQERIKTGDPYTVSRIYRSAKASAKSRGIDFSLTPDDIRSLLSRAAGRCELTGIHFNNDIIAGARRRPWVPSMDRIDATKGYTPNNVRLVCVAMNIAISDFGLEVFDKLVKSYRRKKKYSPITSQCPTR